MAKIPDMKPYGISHDSWIRSTMSDVKEEDYNRIFKDRKPNPGHTTYYYVNGKRVEKKNKSTQ